VLEILEVRLKINKVLLITIMISSFSVNAKELSLSEEAETMAEYWVASLLCSAKDGLQEKHHDFFLKHIIF
tara:strand:- start:30 stop:242 length:213 start_codon:yes stop_codon:yes gene_type:complete